MPKKAPSLPPQMPPMHERYNGKHWQLRDIVSIFVDVINNDTYFSVCLTRIPTPGEFITYGAIEYRVLRVSHCPVDDDGRTTVGYHAFIDAEWLPEDPPLSGRRKKKRPADH